MSALWMTIPAPLANSPVLASPPGRTLISAWAPGEMPTPTHSLLGFSAAGRAAAHPQNGSSASSPSPADDLIARSGISGGFCAGWPGPSLGCGLICGTCHRPSGAFPFSLGLWALPVPRDPRAFSEAPFAGSAVWDPDAVAVKPKAARL